MCGIVGYLGPKDPKQVILTGLKALEYRGYDSAGVAILKDRKFSRVRAEGKLSRLEEKLKDVKFDGHLGIGHTRWATHGVPNEKNAHPHAVGGIALVHNGIIENHSELKKELVSGGAVIESDTDSEIIAHLIAREVAGGMKLFEATQKIRARLKGAYAVLVVNEEEPDTIVAFKNGPPLVVGLADPKSDASVYVASDVQALVPYTRQVVFLKDNQVALVNSQSLKVFDGSGKETPIEVETMEWNDEVANKGGFAHYMLKEIYEQPRAVAAAIQPHIDVSNQSVKMNLGGEYSINELAKVERIFIVACGTSNYAGMVGEYLIERMARIPVECDIASEFRYRHPVLPKNSLFISISQSGETADTLAAVRMAKEAGVPVLSICNVKSSSIDREAQGRLYINAGVEIGVASTKAFSATLAILEVLALQLAKVKSHLNSDDEKSLVGQLIAAPSHIETVLNLDKFFKVAADELKGHKGFLYLGRGVHFPIALEGALKLKELAYMHAEGYASGEMKHGPLALIDERMGIVSLVPHDELYEKSMSNLEEARARGGQIIAISSGGNSELKKISKYYISLPEVEWFTLPLIEIIPVQLMAYHVATSLGHDVDQPRNLAKSVTVE